MKYTSLLIFALLLNVSNVHAQEPLDLAHVRDTLIVHDLMSVDSHEANTLGLFNSLQEDSTVDSTWWNDSTRLICIGCPPGNDYPDPPVYTRKISDSVLSVTIKTAEFDKHHHVYHLETSGDTVFNSTINGKPFWGMDGGIPRQSIVSVSVKFKGQSLRIPVSAYDDLYEPGLNSTSAYRSRDGKRIYVIMQNGDAAGSYNVAWIFVNGKYWNRVIEFGE